MAKRQWQTLLLIMVAAPIIAAPSNANTDQIDSTQLDSWQQVVRQSPYWISQGAYDNLATIRRWVLKGESYCKVKDRHILFDRRGTFLSYLTNGATPEETQIQLNRIRQQLAEAGRVQSWVAGAENKIGYPFALSCDQPNAQLSVALARYLGEDQAARLWGTWDGMSIGSENDRVALHEAIRQVYEDRRQQGRISLPPEVLSVLAGKTLIESGGRQRAHSTADARGIMQLSPAALADCELDERFHFHRMAQVDCTLRLLEQNHRNLEPVFKPKFGHLPQKKADDLYSLLLIQAYHGGVGRISALLASPAADYFAKHHARFSAADIALGLIFHHLGHDQIGFASLYYVADVVIAKQEICHHIERLPGC